MSQASSGSVEARINGLIEERLSVIVASPDTDLIASGLLDSLALVMLITALEDAFDCELALDDFDPESFRTITGIADFVRSSSVLDDSCSTEQAELHNDSRPRAEPFVEDLTLPTPLAGQASEARPVALSGPGQTRIPWRRR